jgi:hypothetical protein
MAVSTTPWAINGYRIAFFETCNPRPEVRHPSRVFVPQGEFAAKTKIFFYNVQSEWHTPAPPILIRTWPGPGSGLGTSAM